MSHYEILIKHLKSLYPGITDLEFQRKIREFDKELKMIMWPDSPTKHSRHNSFGNFKKGKTKNFKIEWIAPVGDLLQTNSIDLYNLLMKYGEQ